MTICCIPKLFPHTEVKERIKKKKKHRPLKTGRWQVLINKGTYIRE